MNKVKGILLLLVAIAMFVFLVVGWDLLGRYTMYLAILPNVPLMSARLFVALGGLGMAISSKPLLFSKSEKPTPSAVENIQSVKNV